MFVAFFAINTGVHAQQDPMYTQYMDNLLVINPGFAGSRDVGNAMVVSRTQWVEFDGAPATNSLAYNSSIEDKNIGFGVSVMTDKIGPLKQTGVYFDYSYFLQVSEDFRLGMGLKGGVSFYRANLTELETINPDPIFDNDIYENFIPNVGVGFYLFSDDTYFGLSVPRLIENKITREDISTEYVNRQEMHLYINGGHNFHLNEEFDLKTNAMVKWVQDTPISFDINAIVGFQNKVFVGAMYRYHVAFGVIAQFKPTPKMSLGYSYDMSIAELNGFNNGTHEIMVSYDIDFFNRRTESQAMAQKR